jgi:hypothetical protein
VITRKPGWEKLMAAAVEERRKKPFDWTRDCAMTAADILLAYTGVDFAAEFRGAYSSALGSRRMTAGFLGGLDGLVEEVCRKHGLPEVSVSHAMRGDVAYFEVDPQFPCVGIINGAEAIVPGEAGLRGLKTKTAKRIWRVPFMSF